MGITKQPVRDKPGTCPGAGTACGQPHCVTSFVSEAWEGAGEGKRKGGGLGRSRELHGSWERV